MFLWFMAQALRPAGSTCTCATTRLTVLRAGDVVQLEVGSVTVLVNGAPYVLADAPTLVNERLYAPVEFWEDVLGFTATWNPTTQDLALDW